MEYKGTFKDGKMHGNGSLTIYRNKEEVVRVYDGQWINGKKDGFGRERYFKNGVLKKLVFGTFIDGVFMKYRLKKKSASLSRIERNRNKKNTYH